MKNKKKDTSEILSVKERIEEEEKTNPVITFGKDEIEDAEEIEGSDVLDEDFIDKDFHEREDLVDVKRKPEPEPVEALDPRTSDCWPTTRDLPDLPYQEKQAEKEKALYLKKIARSENNG